MFPGMATPRLPVSRLDVAARLLSGALPRAAAPHIDRVRLDARAILSSLGPGLPPVIKSKSGQTASPTPLEEIDLIDQLLPRRMAAAVHQLGRDLNMLGGTLTGRTPPPTIERGPSAYARPEETPAGSLSSRRVRITFVRDEAPDVRSFGLAFDDGAALEFEAGQFLSFELPVDGALERRAYSLASAALPGVEPFITVKRVPDGKVSSAFVDGVEEGQTVRVLGPSGLFVVPANAGDTLVLIGGGSGITPLASIAETTLRKDDTRRVVLVYGNRTEEDVIFRARLEALAAEFPERFRLELAFGTRLDADVLHQQLGDLPALATYFLCGPGPMMDACRAALLEAKVSPGRILEERFSRSYTADVSFEDQPVVVQVGAKEYRYPCRAGQTLLEAGREAGVALPFSCAMGGCAACKVELVSGRVNADESSCLSAEERAAGYVLTCVSRPLTPITLKAEL
jgi:ferredoxin-NADP reductase